MTQFNLLLVLFTLAFSLFSGCTSSKAPEVKVVEEHDYLNPPLTLSYIANDSAGIVVFKEGSVEPSDVNDVMGKLNWYEFNIVWLENKEGDVLKVEGSEMNGGFSASYVNHNSDGKFIEERVSPYKVITENVMRIILKYGIEKPELVKEAYFWDQDYQKR